MNRWCALLLAAVLSPGIASASVDREWRFRVLLDAKPVGVHTFRVTERDGGERRVASDARFTVKFLFVDAYTYVHEARERWQGDCLQELRASTDDNGKRLAVRGTGDAAGFAVEGNGAPLPACVMTFAYWNPAILKQPRLLNVQSGEFTDVRIEPLGEETLRVRGAAVNARRYALHAPKFRIDLWYSGANWVQLESRTEGGRLLRYEIE